MIVFVFLGAERESSVTVIGGEGCEIGGELDGEICECGERFGGIEGIIDVWTSAMIACVRMIVRRKDYKIGGYFILMQQSIISY